VVTDKLLSFTAALKLSSGRVANHEDSAGESCMCPALPFQSEPASPDKFGLGFLPPATAPAKALLKRFPRWVGPSSPSVRICAEKDAQKAGVA
jgi:hypothetical protein